MTDAGPHREFLYMAVAWGLMDLRQDIEFAHLCTDTDYPVNEIVSRLRGLQDEVTEYADAQLGNADWGVRND